jgi:hypothetical protein
MPRPPEVASGMRYDFPSVVDVESSSTIVDLLILDLLILDFLILSLSITHSDPTTARSDFYRLIARSPMKSISTVPSKLFL